MHQAKILIVDDNEDNRAVLMDALEGEEYELFEACDGEAAIRSVEQNLPDLVLLDVEMPKMDGITALKQIKSNPDTQHITVIMVTALNTDSQISVCLDSGAADHIVKPFSNMIVRARVRAAVRTLAIQKSENEPTQIRGKVVTFIGAKGGVGTTTAVVNTAAILANQAKSIITCELRESHGTMVTHLGSGTALNLQVLLDGDSGRIGREKLKDCLVNHPVGFRTLLGPQNFDPLELSHEDVESIISGLAIEADVVLCDAPSICSAATSQLCQRSDLIILVVEMEQSAMVAAKQWMKHLNSLGIGTSSLRILAVNRVQADMPISPSDLRTNLGCKMIGVIPADSHGCLTALRTGVLPITMNPQSAFTGALTAFANRLTEQNVSEIVF